MALPDARTANIRIAVELHLLGAHIVPLAFDADGLWPSDPDQHVVGDEHQFCLNLSGVDDPVIDEPDDLLQWMDDVIVFVRQQLIANATPGGFPGPEWPHGPRAYAAHIVEQLSSLTPTAREAAWNCLRGVTAWPDSRNAPCCCGSGRKFKKCCLLPDERKLSALAHENKLTSLPYRELEKYADQHVG